MTVSETTVDTTMAKVSVSENSRNSRPTIPSMKISGVKAAISDRLIDSTVKPICLAPSSAAASGAMPCSRLRYMFSIMTMASSTTKPTEIASAISDRLSIENPASHMPAQVPASASGTETPAAIVGVSRRRNSEHHQHDQERGRQQRELHVEHAGADGAGAVDQRRNVDAGRASIASVPGSSAFTRSTVSMTLASPCLVIWISTAGCLLNQAIERLLRDGVLDLGDVGEADEIAVRALDDDVAEFGRACASACWSQIVSLWRPPLKMPTGPSGLALTIAVPHVVGRDPGVRQRDRVERDRAPPAGRRR